MGSAQQSVQGSGLRRGYKFDNTVLVILRTALRDNNFVGVGCSVGI